MDLSAIPPSPMKGIVNIVVEIPAGSRNKYEYCSDAGIMALDRVLHSSVRYPFDYGFIPNTLADDGAPLDAMVIMDEPTFAGCLIKARLSVLKALPLVLKILFLSSEYCSKARLMVGGILMWWKIC